MGLLSNNALGEVPSESYSPVQLQAREFHRYDLPTVPLISPDAESKVAGKAPALPDWQNLTVEKAEENLGLIKENYGVVLTPRWLVIDIDPRNKGDVSFQRLCEHLQVQLQKVAGLVVQTGSGGYHLYFNKPPEIKIRSRLSEWPGIDFLSVGHQVVGPGSVHAVTKQTYTVKKGSLEDCVPPPANLLTLLMAREVVNPKETAIEMFYDDPFTAQYYADWLRKKAPAAVQGNRENTVYIVACKGKELGVSPADTVQAILQYWNPEKCDPPLESDRIEEKVTNAYRYGQTATGANNPLANVKSLVPEVVDFQTSSTGTVKKTLHNAALYFQQSEELLGLLRYNELTQEIEFMRRAPWHPRNSKISAWTDIDSIQLKYWFSTKYQLELGTETVFEVAHLAAHKYPYHPIKRYLESLIWDRVPRLEHWLSLYCGADDNSYTQSVGKKLLFAAIKRIYNPGCKFDYIVVLEGPQGVGKSQTCSILGKYWAAAPSMDIHSKDAVDQIKGKWIIEFAEMETTTRAETQALKAFITRDTDRVRPAYGRVTIDFPRSCVFIGTINPDDNGYLKDTTGNRRYWPIECGEFDLNGLRDDVDMLWAEAKYLIDEQEHKEELYLDDKKVEKIACSKQADREVYDSWVEPIGKYLENKGWPIVSADEVFVEALQGSLNSFERGKQIRIATALKKLGYIRKSVRLGTEVCKRYVKEVVKEEKNSLLDF